MRTKPRFATAIFACLLLAAAHTAHSLQDPMAEFTKQVDSYLELHKKAAASVPKPKVSEDAAEILKTQELLAAEIRKYRTSAKAGDIFLPSVRPALINLIQAKLGGKEGEAARKTVLGEGNPKNPGSASPVELKVNATYPTTAPMSTVPPSLLTTLPTLPEELEFRFVGRHLILRDTKANVIVDILTNAVPEK